MVTPLFLFGLGPIEVAIIIAIVLLLFGPPLVKVVAKRAGEVSSATDQAVEEFEAGRGGS